MLAVVHTDEARHFLWGIFCGAVSGTVIFHKCRLDLVYPAISPTVFISDKCDLEENWCPSCHSAQTPLLALPSKFQPEEMCRRENHL